MNHKSLAILLSLFFILSSAKSQNAIDCNVLKKQIDSTFKNALSLNTSKNPLKILDKNNDKPLFLHFLNQNRGMKKVFNIEDFSPALFWDVDKKQLNFEQHRRFIIERTLTHGTLSDWFLIKACYGKEIIKTESMQIRFLDKQTLSFCAAYFNESIQNFRCYILKQSNPSHWDY